jgi:hypothetical protein
VASPENRPIDPPRNFPRVPAYAWSWLQRSRPVLAEVARRLTGGAPPAGFVDTLREQFADDAFTRDVVVGVIADVAFNGRIPRHRPPGVSWDRGLTWWAATIAGVTPEAFEAAPPNIVQSRLFGVEDRSPRRPPSPRPTGTRRSAASERAALAGALRDLLRGTQGDMVPAAAIRQLLAQLEEQHSAEGPRPE